MEHSQATIASPSHLSGNEVLTAFYIISGIDCSTKCAKVSFQASRQWTTHATKGGMKSKLLVALALLTLLLLVLLPLFWKSSWTKPNGRNRCLMQIANCGAEVEAFREKAGRLPNGIEELREPQRNCFCPVTRDAYQYTATSNGFVLVESTAHRGGRSWVDQNLKAATIPDTGRNSQGAPVAKNLPMP